MRRDMVVGGVGLVGAAAVLGLTIQMMLHWRREYIVFPPSTCYQALAERPSIELQGYEREACRAAGLDMEEADAHRIERLARVLTPEERVAMARAARASWTRSYGALPDPATFCATPGITCLE